MNYLEPANIGAVIIAIISTVFSYALFDPNPFILLPLSLVFGILSFMYAIRDKLWMSILNLIAAWVTSFVPLMTQISINVGVNIDIYEKLG